MDFASLIGPAVVAAIVSGAVTLVGHYLSGRSSRAMNHEKIASERELAERKFKAEMDLAERKFRHEQSLHDYRRKVEFGEDILASFYRLRDVIRSVRGPFAWANEGEKRKRDPNENEAEARRRDGYHVPMVRLQNESTFLSELFSKRYRALALFGKDIDRAFELSSETIKAIQIASSMLVDHVGQPRDDPEFWRGLEKEIWDMSKPDQPDELNQRILNAITIVEKAVRPTLGVQPKDLT